MSYTAPAGNAVNFQATGISYAAPAGDAVVFDPSCKAVVSASISALCNAALIVDARADVSGVIAVCALVEGFQYPAVSARCRLRAFGDVSLQTHPTFAVIGTIAPISSVAVSVRSACTVSGFIQPKSSVQLHQQARIDAVGIVRMSSSIQCSHISAISGGVVAYLYPHALVELANLNARISARISPKASVAIKQGVNLNSSGKLAVRGSVSAKFAASCPVDGRIVIKAGVSGVVGQSASVVGLLNAKGAVFVKSIPQTTASVHGVIKVSGMDNQCAGCCNG